MSSNSSKASPILSARARGHRSVVRRCHGAGGSRRDGGREALDFASPRKSPEPLGLHLLPEDLSAICAGYLRVADVVTYSACSEATREWYESEEPWEGFLEPLCLRESWWFGLQDDEDDDEPSARARVLHHAFSLRLARALPGVGTSARKQCGNGTRTRRVEEV